MKPIAIPLLILALFACAAPNTSTDKTESEATTSKTSVSPENRCNLEIKVFIAGILGPVKTLGASWDTVIGKASEKTCAINYKIDEDGNILEYNTLSCDISPEQLKKVMLNASPLPKPANACMLEKTNQSTFTFNKNKLEVKKR